MHIHIYLGTHAVFVTLRAFRLQVAAHLHGAAEGGPLRGVAAVAVPRVQIRQGLADSVRAQIYIYISTNIQWYIDMIYCWYVQ